jgi:WD40 repeat protein
MMYRPLLISLLLFVGLVTGAEVTLSAPASSVAARAAHASASRLLYTGDWSGSREVYAVDPAHAGSIAQVTFGHDPSCDPLADACGFAGVVPSPDGRYVAFQTEGLCGGSGYLYVARADGRAQHQIARLDGCAAVVWAPDSRRLAYVVNADNPSIYVTAVDGSRIHRLSYGADPSWSPDGRSLALLDNHVLWIARNGRFHTVSSGVNDYAWSPSGKWLAIAAPQLEIIRTDGSGRRPLSDSTPGKISWSHDGRFIAYSGYLNGAETVDIATRTTRVVGAIPGELSETWSHRGHLLAFDGRDGLSLFDAQRGTTRHLTSDHSQVLAWAPDDRSIAYLDGDIRIVTLPRAVRTVVSASGTAGGVIDSLVWTRPPAGRRYRPVEPRTAATVSGNELVAPWPIEHLAADGSHVLYVTCGHLFVWAPAAGEVVQAERAASLVPRCTTAKTKNYVAFDIYDVALAGDRIAFGDRWGNMSQGWDLYQQPLADPSAIQKLDSDGGFAGCTLGRAGLGDLVGAGDLLVFSRWEEPIPDSRVTCGIATNQRIYRVDASGCPCPKIATSPGPLLPADVDGGRIVAAGSNDTVVMDSTGARLMAVPVRALAAQLAGPDLVVLVQGQLRDYDAATGALTHAWPLPDVASGSPCGSPHPWGCPSVRLELEDAARGLAAYVLDGEVHVVQLADGTDVTIGKGMSARFMDDGLVYADGADLHLVPYTTLTSTTTR